MSGTTLLTIAPVGVRVYTAELARGSYRASLGIEVRSGIGLDVAVTGTAFPSDLLAFASSLDELQDGSGDHAAFQVTTWHPWLEIGLDRHGATVSGEIWIRLKYASGQGAVAESRITFDQYPVEELTEVAKAFRYAGEQILG